MRSSQARTVGRSAEGTPGVVTPGAADHPARTPPGPARRSVRTGVEFLTDPLGLLTRLHREYGPIVRAPIGRGDIYLVNDPEAIQDVLVASQRVFAKGIRRRRMPVGEGIQPLTVVLGTGLLTSAGELHRIRRRLIQPLFHHQRVAAYGTAFAALAEEAADRWVDGAGLDLHAEMSELTLGIVAKTVFDVPIDSNVVSTVRRALAANMGVSRRAILPGGRHLEKVPLPATRRARVSRAELDAVVRKMIADRRRNPTRSNDLLSLLLAARDAETGAPLDDDAIRDEALTILLAGHETTANALAWTFHLLAGSPRVRDALHLELDHVLGDRLPRLDDLAHLPYTQAVVTESMRLYPPAWVLLRRTLAEHSLGGYTLPAGATVMMSQWVVHRDPRYWPDPDGFIPERWVKTSTTEPAPDRPRFAFFPFGGGARQCIGNAFAEIEAAMVLATICRRWRFTPVPGTRVVPLPRVTLRPRNGLPMTAHRREPRG